MEATIRSTQENTHYIYKFPYQNLFCRTIESLTLYITAIPLYKRKIILGREASNQKTSLRASPRSISRVTSMMEQVRQNLPQHTSEV